MYKIQFRGHNSDTKTVTRNIPNVLVCEDIIVIRIATKCGLPQWAIPIDIALMLVVER